MKNNRGWWRPPSRNCASVPVLLAFGGVVDAGDFVRLSDVTWLQRRFTRLACVDDYFRNFCRQFFFYFLFFIFGANEVVFGLDWKEGIQRRYIVTGRDVGDSLIWFVIALIYQSHTILKYWKFCDHIWNQRHKQISLHLSSRGWLFCISALFNTVDVPFVKKKDIRNFSRRGHELQN